jgi:hypothetical protein
MKGLDNITAALQVGVRKTAAEPAGVIQGWSDPRPEKAILVESGALSLMQKAGAAPRSGLRPLGASPAETKRWALAAGDPLLEALEMNLPELALEWAEEAAKHGVLAPPSTLLKLLELAPKHPLLWSVLGERARWLASLMGMEVGVHSDESSQVTQEEWPKLHWREKCALLERMTPRLEDEPFLTSACADRRSEVRELAIGHLVRLPDSDLAKNLRTLAKGRITVERRLLKKKLGAEPPEPDDLPKILPRTKSHQGMGPKALALFDLVRHLPPSFWAEATGVEFSELFRLAQTSDYTAALREGWLEAATLTFRDPASCEVLLTSLSKNRLVEAWHSLCAVVDEGAFVRALKANPDNKILILHGLRSRPGPISPALFPYAFELGKTLATPEVIRLATRLDLSALHSLSNPWPDDSEPIRLSWIQVLDLRTRLRQTLQP